MQVFVAGTILFDNQNEIRGTALGLNGTFWGLVPNLGNFAVSGGIDAMLYLRSTGEDYDFDQGENNFGANFALGMGPTFLLSRELNLVTFVTLAPGVSKEDALRYMIRGRFKYSEDFYLSREVDGLGVLPSERVVGSQKDPEIVVQFVPLIEE
jgi:hypothetical protein